MHTHRKLLVYGLNLLIERDLVSLNPDVELVDGVLQCDIGERNSALIWRDINGDEFQLTVWWDYDRSASPREDSFKGPLPLAKPQRYPEFVGAISSGWVARRKIPFIQGYGHDLAEKYTRRESARFLHELRNPTPLGFEAEGRFLA
ncbi:hypothetical protein WKI45_25250 [Delftia tsuruhatensis]